MAKKYRVKCPKCGNVQNVLESGPCAKCGETLSVDQPGMIGLYRMGNFVGSAAGFGIYLNEQPCGGSETERACISRFPTVSIRCTSSAG